MHSKALLAAAAAAAAAAAGARLQRHQEPTAAGDTTEAYLQPHWAMAGGVSSRLTAAATAAAAAAVVPAVARVAVQPNPASAHHLEVRGAG
jgi:hypothetical protein